MSDDMDDWAAAMSEQSDAEASGEVSTAGGGVASAELDELTSDAPAQEVQQVMSRWMPFWMCL